MQIQIPKNTYFTDFTQFPSSISQKLPLAIDKFGNTDLDIKRYFEGCLRFDREFLRKEAFESSIFPWFGAFSVVSTQTVRTWLLCKLAFFGVDEVPGGTRL